MPGDLFRSPTVAALAASAAEMAPAVADEGPVSGVVPLTPVQRWFFDSQPARPGHFGQSVLVELAGWPDGAALRTALAALTGHHDALRMRFGQARGEWAQYNPPPPPAHVLAGHRLSPAAAGRQQTAMNH